MKRLLEYFSVDALLRVLAVHAVVVRPYDEPPPTGLHVLENWLEPPPQSLSIAQFWSKPNVPPLPTPDWVPPWPLLLLLPDEKTTDPALLVYAAVVHVGALVLAGRVATTVVVRGVVAILLLAVVWVLLITDIVVRAALATSCAAHCAVHPIARPRVEQTRVVVALLPRLGGGCHS